MYKSLQSKEKLVPWKVRFRLTWDFFSLALLNARSLWFKARGSKFWGKIIFSIEYRILCLAKLSTREWHPKQSFLCIEIIMLYSFPMAAVTKNYKSSGLKKKETYFLTILEARNLKSVSLSWNQDIDRAALPLVVGENPSLPLPASDGSWHTLVCGCITLAFKTSIFRSLCVSSSYLLLLYVCVRNLHLPLSYKDTYDLHLGLIWIILKSLT